MGTKARRTILLAVLTLAISLAFTVPVLAGLGGKPSQDEAWRAGGGESPLLTEFGDFQCPHCGRFAMGILPQLERDLISHGLVRFEYRHYPFLGEESWRAAEAAECARDQGQFGGYHQMVYEKIARGGGLNDEILKLAAEEMGLETGSFNRCLDGGHNRGRVQEDLEYGKALGIRGTPTLFLNGRELRWADYGDLLRQITEVVLAEDRSGPPPGQE